MKAFYFWLGITIFFALFVAPALAYTCRTHVVMLPNGGSVVCTTCCTERGDCTTVCN